MAFQPMYIYSLSYYIGYTINPEGLDRIVKKAMIAREERMLTNQHLTVQVDSALAKVIKDSKAISSKQSVS